jgi:branched-chain amino acid transport system permease protein
VRRLLTFKNTSDAAFWGGCLAVAFVLFFVVYDNAVFGGHWVIFALYASINLMWMLVIGTAGLYSFATLGVVGTAAYIGAWLSGGSQAGEDLAGARSLNVVFVLLAAAAVGAVYGAIIAAPTIRLRGIYFALFTFGLTAASRALIENQDFLGKHQGLSGAARLLRQDWISTEKGRTIDFLVGLALIVFCLIVYKLVDGGRLGLLLRTVRESEGVARGIGVDVVRARFAVFIISSAVLGMVGGFYSSYYGGVSLTIFDFNTLLLLFAMIVVGGLGSAKGAIIGTALLVYIDETYADIDTPAWRLIWIGIIMFAVTLLTTRGLVGVPSQIRGYIQRRRARQAPGEAEPVPTPAELEVPGL